MKRFALTSSLLLVSAALVGAFTVSSATADESPSPSPSSASTDPASPSADPSASDSPDPSPSSTDSASPTPSESPSESTSPSPSTQAKAKATVADGRSAGYYNPNNGVIFNYPYSSSQESRDIIRYAVRKLIQAVPSGGHLRIAMYSINDDDTVDDLIAAKNRGVSVQVVVNEHNVHGTPGHASSPSFIRLMRTLGTARGNNSTYQKVSWARYCVKSCRGYNGDVHYKMILADKVNNTSGTVTHFTTMMGSPNLTILAANGQYNHLNTYVDGVDLHPTYSAYYNQFKEMALDRPAKVQYKNYTLSYYHHTSAGPTAYGVPTWFFPKPGANTPQEDPSYTELNDVVCTGTPDSSFNNNGRTVIRIGAYAWYENRGVWMAKRIRQLWDRGCDVQIETSVMGNTVKSILYSPKGRGRIPIKQIGTYGKDGTVLTYDHAKWISVSGNYGGKKSIKIWTGTQNWSNLALSSDDSTQIYTYINGGKDKFGTRLMYQRYFENFQSIWKGPHASTASPKSTIPGDVGGPNAQFGVGKYRNVQAD